MTSNTTTKAPDDTARLPWALVVLMGALALYCAWMAAYAGWQIAFGPEEGEGIRSESYLAFYLSLALVNGATVLRKFGIGVRRGTWVMMGLAFAAIVWAIATLR